MRAKVIFFFFLAAAAIGGAQTHSVTLNWDAPVAGGGWSGCGSGSLTCSYPVYRAIVSNGTTSCPSAPTGYSQIGTAGAPGYSDTSLAGASTATACYFVRTLQAGQLSVPSSVVGPLIMPALAGTLTCADPQQLAPNNSSPPTYNIAFADLPLMVGMVSPTPGCVMHCTFDSSLPTSASAVYAGPYPLTSSEVIRCIAIKAGYNDSGPGGGDWLLNVIALPQPQLTAPPSAGLKAAAVAQ